MIVTPAADGSIRLEIPAQVLEAATKRKLVLFVGSGSSQLLGLPSWHHLASWAINELFKSGHLTFSAVQQLKNLSARMRLSIAIDIASKAGVKLSLDDVLKCHELDSENQTFLNSLVALSGVCVTTNYDLYLEEGRPPPVVSASDVKDSGAIPTATQGAQVNSKPVPDPRKWIALLEDDRAVIHLHGAVGGPGEKTVSTRDYLARYQDEHVRQFLAHLFRSRTVLFIGFALEEVEIIEHLVHSVTAEIKARPPGHFWLYPTLTRDSELLEYLKNYYLNQLGVELIPYPIDQRGYGALKSVINNWSARIPRREVDDVDRLEFVAKVLADGA